MPIEESISLSYALEVHDSFQHCTPIPKNICDGYFYSTNPFYKNIRDSVVALGCEFTEEDFCHYRAFFRGSLQKILKEKKVFYVDNVTRLKEIENQHPNRFDFQTIRLSAAANSIHHESSHIICDSIFTQQLFQPIEHKDLDQKELLRIMIGEAVASTHDSLMSIFNYTRFMQEVGLFQYGTKKQKWEKSIFEPVLDIVDFSGTYKLTFIAYLYSYFLYQKIDRRLLSGVLDYVFPKACFASSEIARFEKIFRNAFTISNVIRIREHGLYFQIFMDSDRSIENLCDFDFMSVLEKNEILMKSLEKIISLAHFGPQKKSLSVVSSQKIKVPA